MFKRYLPAALVVIVAGPLSAQAPRTARIPEPIHTKASFVALFKPVVEQAGRSTVHVQVGGEKKILGTVVADGLVVTKASELSQALADAKKTSKSAQVSVKTYDGRDFDAR